MCPRVNLKYYKVDAIVRLVPVYKLLGKDVAIFTSPFHFVDQHK